MDLTLVTLDGAPVERPSPFDCFGKEAHHAFASGTEASRTHRDALRAAMEAVGFKRTPMEWWRSDLADAARYPLRDERFSQPRPPRAPDAREGGRQSSPR